MNQDTFNAELSNIISSGCGEFEDYREEQIEKLFDKVTDKVKLKQFVNVFYDMNFDANYELDLCVLSCIGELLRCEVEITITFK